MPPARNNSDQNQDLLREVLSGVEEARRWHDPYCQKIDRNYKTWRGVIDRRKEYAQFKFKIFPPYVMQVVDTLLANLIDDKLYFTATARPRITDDPSAIEQLDLCAKAHEILLNAQIDQEPFEGKLEDFYLHAMIANLAVAKTYWKRDAKTIKVLEQLPSEAVMGPPIPTVVERESVRYEGPCTEIIDPRDIWWGPEGITNLQSAEFITHRAFVTKRYLKSLVEKGVYKNLDDILEKGLSEGTSWATDREYELYEQSRVKGLHEVLEHWTPERVIVVVDRKAIAAVYDNPFWHGEYPFVELCLRKDLGRIHGISEVEIIRDLQEGIWAFTNQRLENTELLNNAMWIVRADYDGPDFHATPGGKVVVEDTSQIVPWTPNPISAQISLPAEQMLRGDIQNASGAAPFMSGADTQTIDQKTATGVSIVTTLAQRIMARKKRRAYQALEKIFTQRAALNRQYITSPTLVSVVGDKGASAITILPEMLQADIVIDFEPATEMMMLQERRAQAQALFQMFLQAAGPLQMMGVPVNARAFAEDLLKSFGKHNINRYFSSPSPPQPSPFQPGAPGQVEQLQGDPAQAIAEAATRGAPIGSSGNGVTSELAYGTNSPSNSQSMSPAVFMQRLLASTGRQR